MPLRAPGAGFRVENGRVNERDFEKWARDTLVVPTDGAVTPEMLSAATTTFIDAHAATAAAASITALKAEVNPLPQYATDAEATAAAASAVATHEAAADPHTQYLTKTEGDGFYLPLGTTTTSVAEGTNQYFTGSRARTAARLWTVRAVSANTTAATTDDLITVDASGAARTVNLPALASSQGMRFFVKKIDSSGNAVIIDPNGTETVDGVTTLSITTQYTTVRLVAGASEWHTA
jgi:hypothetical protein